MFVHHIIESGAVQAVESLSDALPQAKLAGVLDAREILVRMLESLNKASDSGWASYPVVPISGITKPALKSLQDPYSGESVSYIAWPAAQYAGWQAAWKSLSNAMGLYTSNFGLGDPTEMQYAISANYVEPFKTAPNAARGAAATVSFLVSLQRKFDNLPEHPRIQGAIDKATKKTKSPISPWTIIGLVAAAAVGGALFWARKTNRWPFVHEATAPHVPTELTVINGVVLHRRRR